MNAATILKLKGTSVVTTTTDKSFPPHARGGDGPAERPRLHRRPGQDAHRGSRDGGGRDAGVRRLACVLQRARGQVRELGRPVGTATHRHRVMRPTGSYEGRRGSPTR